MRRATHPSPAASTADAPSGGDAITLPQLASLGRRLSSEFGALLKSVPDQPGSARSLSSVLGVDRNVCQKVMSACRLRDHRTLIALPGPRSLHALLQASRRHRLPDELVAGAERALSDFAHAVEVGGGTHQRLGALIRTLESESAASGRSTRDGSEELLSLSLRKQHFELTSRLLGVSVEKSISVTVFSDPTPTRGGSLRLSGGNVHVGCRGRPGGVPLVVHAGRLSDAEVE
ncbi:MAG: hypothetical protein K2Q20_14120, partial [Phycisphaerales bacterium]|nr:hypothetical protein [Phycisphaerales bacterium]